MSTRPVVGPGNGLLDVPGLRLGHRTAIGDGYLTGTTVVLAPEGGMTAGVDVRGGGPGTRETDLLDPVASMDRVDAIVLTGGSAFGLAAASGAAEELADAGRGFALGPGPGEVVPIVPAAVLFDLGRGGRFRATPGESFGRAAVRQALSDDVVPQSGSVGAGTGAVVAGLKGGLGSASQRVGDRCTVAALVAVNAIGSPVETVSGRLAGAAHLLHGDGYRFGSPAPTEVPDVLRHGKAREPVPGQDLATQSVRNTTIGVVATDLALTKAQCTKLAGLAHDGLARALDPVHTLFDGDTIFGVSTRRVSADDDLGLLHEVLVAAAAVTTRAVVRAVLAARTTSTDGGTWPGYLDLAPSLAPE